jgi:hypothetical protein
MTLTKEMTQDIRKIQSILTNIKNGTKCFYNIMQYKNLGLITMTKKYKTTIAGNREWNGFNIRLTKKAEEYLKVVV